MFDTNNYCKYMESRLNVFLRTVRERSVSQWHQGPNNCELELKLHHRNEGRTEPTVPVITLPKLKLLLGEAVNAFFKVILTYRKVKMQAAGLGHLTLCAEVFDFARFQTDPASQIAEAITQGSLVIAPIHMVNDAKDKQEAWHELSELPKAGNVPV